MLAVISMQLLSDFARERSLGGGARGRAVGNEMLCVRRRVTSFSFAKRFKRTAAQPLWVPGRSPAAFGDFSPVKSHPPEGMAQKQRTNYSQKAK